jgi:SAM-dependent methyltransferase
MADGPSSYAHLAFNAPLSGERADALARRLAAAEPRTVVDVGCGWGELLLRVTAAAPGAAATGLDTDAALLERARTAAAGRGLEHRVRFIEQDGASYHEPADLVLCVASTQAFGVGDAADAITALRGLVRPGGRLLLGEGFWEPAGPVDRDLVWDDVLELPDLAGLVDQAVGSGLRPLWIETASPAEWEVFESGFLADDEEWLLHHLEHADATRVRERADDHRTRWLRGYRHGLGFAYLTLGRPD